MKNQISDLTLMTTEECNFNCTYCFVRQRPVYMDLHLAKEALDALLQRGILTSDALIYFNGGEPFLNYDLIRGVVNYLNHSNKTANTRFRYGVSTNGSLITDEILDFIIANQFTIEVSFDGLNHDHNRLKGSSQPTIELVKKLIKVPNLNLMINGVYPPDRIHNLAASIRLILELGVKRTNFSVCHSYLWEEEDFERLKTEYQKVGDLVTKYYQEHRFMPVENFNKKSKGIWSCGAGNNQMTLTSEGELWGCMVIYEYFKSHQDKHFQHKDFCFGHFRDFLKDPDHIYSKIMENHAFIRMDEFRTGKDGREWCFKCEKLPDCGICPFDGAQRTGSLGLIPQYSCRLRKLAIGEYHRVWDILDDLH